VRPWQAAPQVTAREATSGGSCWPWSWPATAGCADDAGGPSTRAYQDCTPVGSPWATWSPITWVGVPSQPTCAPNTAPATWPTPTPAPSPRPCSVARGGLVEGRRAGAPGVAAVAQAWHRACHGRGGGGGVNRTRTGRGGCPREARRARDRRPPVLTARSCRDTCGSAPNSAGRGDRTAVLLGRGPIVARVIVVQPFGASWPAVPSAVEQCGTCERAVWLSGQATLEPGDELRCIPCAAAAWDGEPIEPAPWVDLDVARLRLP
jgi:hypothetical protein